MASYPLHVAEKENILEFGLWPGVELLVYWREVGQVYPPLKGGHSPVGAVK